MLTNDETDLSKAVFSEGDWHIVPVKHVNSWVTMNRKSIIVHKCPFWKDMPTSEGWYWKQYGYWATAEHVDKSCKLCMHSPPAAIVHLFMLHNFDTFAGDDIMERSVIKHFTKINLKFDQMMFLTGSRYDDKRDLAPIKEPPKNMGPDE